MQTLYWVPDFTRSMPQMQTAFASTFHRGGGAALSAPGVADNTPAFKTDKAVGALGDVEWEYKWSEDAEELYGPYTSEQMLGWQGEGYFKGDVVVRRVGTADFHKAARVDFDLYT
eukprot:Opistho-2@70113